MQQNYKVSMNLTQRIKLLDRLGKYIENNSDEWQATKLLASQHNPWFTLAFIDLALKNITTAFLDEQKLKEWAGHYQIAEENPHPQNVGIVMAGNIPLVGFHDFLCAFITGQKQRIKLSTKDDILLKALIKKLAEWDQEIVTLITFADNLKGCDAYIATGSDNSGRYFELYFGKYPNIIRKNRSSVAVLTGKETEEELNLLVTDLQTYFGLGCRNVTKIYVPQEYDFVPLVNALKVNEDHLNFTKYKNNYDYQLAILLLNKQFYMSGGSLLLRENTSIFAPLSVANYEYYDTLTDLNKKLSEHKDEIQCIVGQEFIPFGKAQYPSLYDYADDIDTMLFFQELEPDAS